VKRTMLWATLLTALAACAPRSVPAQDPGTTDTTRTGLVPAGHGQLSQDVITLVLRSGDLDIRFTPLDERVTRLLAPDAWQSLQELIARHRVQIDSATTRLGIRNPGLVLVAYFALAADTRFDPQLLTIGSRNQLMRPGAIVPLSPAFSNQQLDVGGQAMGLYIFEDPIPVTEPFLVSYRDATTNDWERRLSRFDRERARIQSRAGAGAADPGVND
jgi:hypothetical protein